MSPDATAIQFEFIGLAVTKSLFEYLAAEEKLVGGERPTVVSLGVEVGATAQISKDKTGAFVTLDVKIIPDQKHQPYRIEVSISGSFRSSVASVDDLLRFCRVNAPSILFPYIRENVHRMTMDAPNGTVRLNPMNISQLLNQTEWIIKDTSAHIPGDSSERPNS